MGGDTYCMRVISHEALRVLRALYWGCGGVEGFNFLNFIQTIQLHNLCTNNDHLMLYYASRWAFISIAYMMFWQR